MGQNVDPLGPDARDLLASYRRERPGANGRARNWPGVCARIDARAEAPARRSTSALWFGGIALVLAAAVLLLVHAVFVAWQATQLERTEPTPAASDVAPAPAVDDVHAPAPMVAREHAAATPVVAASPTVTVEPTPLQRPRVDVPEPPPVDTTAEELELVARARTALAADDFPTARAALDEHARRFAKGALAEERSAYRAILSCRTRAADARTTQLDFATRYPSSHHHRSIKAACTSPEDASTP